ncbi:DUF4423 domain-containing protein, partial [Serratia bockelmannii]|uniref:DUF4423 domain-containing protein n=1 Tax=Serratia bockelmannii TaxID=2703793 RepID=UPI003CF6098D
AHIQDLGLIENALVHLPVELRTTSSITAPILIKDLEKARKLKDEFQDRFMDIMESSEGDEVYRLSISFFPLTQPEIKK